MNNQADQIIGHGYEPFLPYVTVIVLFVLACNCFGLLPGVETPTADPVVPLGIAILTFIYYNWQGRAGAGPVGYIKHFLGPIWWISSLIFPIEIISHLARMHVAYHPSLCEHVCQRSADAGLFSLIPIGDSGHLSRAALFCRRSFRPTFSCC